MTPDIILAISSIYTYADKVGKKPEDVYDEWKSFSYGRFSEKKIKTENSVKVNEDDVNEIYSLYPTTDPNNNNRPLGKGSGTKKLIRNLLTKGKTKEELIKAVEDEVQASRRGTWLKNANTFFNNLPEPDIQKSAPIKIDQIWQ